MAARIKAFLDTSVLFAGIWSSAGGARMILKLGEAGAIQLLISSRVVSEIEHTLREKAPASLGFLALLLDRSGVTIVPAGSEEIVDQCTSLVKYPGDVQVLAAAWGSNVDFFVTLDRKHFLDNQPLMASAPFAMGAPGDFLAWFRSRLAT